MARKRKCKICKKELDNIRFNTIVDGKPFYCCNEAEFNYFNKEKQAKEELLNVFKFEIFKYKGNQILPPVLLKKINEVNEGYSFEVILKTVNVLKTTLQYWANADGKFTSDYSKACYLVSIISNRINDIYKEFELKSEQKDESKTLEGFDIDMINLERETKERSSANDISSFLD